MRPDDAKMTGKSKLFWCLIIIGFMCMEFPGVFFFKSMSEPYLFGFPFIYGFNLIMWGYFVIVITCAYLNNWGEPKKGEKTEGGGNE